MTLERKMERRTITNQNTENITVVQWNRRPFDSILPFLEQYLKKKKKKKKNHQHQVSLQTEYCRKCPYDFDLTALNVGLTQIPLFHDEKIYTARNSREKS